MTRLDELERLEKAARLPYPQREIDAIWEFGFALRNAAPALLAIARAARELADSPELDGIVDDLRSALAALEQAGGGECS